MSPRERLPSHETTPQDTYSKATEILLLHGHPSSNKINITRRMPRRLSDLRQHVPTESSVRLSTNVPIVPIQIEGNEYRLRLKGERYRPDEHDETIKLSIHFQRFPYGLVRIEYDTGGFVTGYWYNPADESELKHLEVPRERFLPKELQFSWYIAKTYSIEPNSNSSHVGVNVPPNIVEGLGDGNDFLLTILEKMQTELDKKPA